MLGTHAFLFGTTALVTGLALVAGAHANPQGGRVVRGQVTIEGAGTPDLTVRQTTGKGIINWNSFSIDQGERTRFVQPDQNSVTLNRVAGKDLSRIAGALDANGRVVLVNPNGVIFDKTARVDVQSLIATTSRIADKDFMDGRLKFTPGARPGAKVNNSGQITVKDGGLVALAGPYVQNDGTITARLGKVALAGGEAFTVDLAGDGLIQLEAGGGTILQEGTIRADGGMVTLDVADAAGLVDGVVSNRGVIEARTIEKRAGRIVLSGGTVEVGGRLDASGETGGSIVVAAKRIRATAEAKLNASGQTGGGTVHLGAGPRGLPPIPARKPAQTIEVAAGVVIEASATTSGKGGEVVAFATGDAEIAGTLRAKGAGGGKGGLVETSGKRLDVDGALIDAGIGGTWLLDPFDIVIIDGTVPDDPVRTYVQADDIALALSLGSSVTIQTTDPIVVGLDPDSQIVPGDQNQPGDVTFAQDVTISPRSDDIGDVVPLLRVIAARDVIFQEGALVDATTAPTAQPIDVSIEAGRNIDMRGTVRAQDVVLQAGGFIRDDEAVRLREVARGRTSNILAVAASESLALSAQNGISFVEAPASSSLEGFNLATTSLQAINRGAGSIDLAYQSTAAAQSSILQTGRGRVRLRSGGTTERTTFSIDLSAPGSQVDIATSGRLVALSVSEEETLASLRIDAGSRGTTSARESAIALSSMQGAGDIDLAADLVTTGGTLTSTGGAISIRGNEGFALAADAPADPGSYLLGFEPLVAAGTVRLVTGASADELQVGAGQVTARDLVIATGAGNDLISVSPGVAFGLDIDSGTEDDTVTVTSGAEGTTGLRDIRVALGAGNDRLLLDGFVDETLIGIEAAAVTIDGGDGIDDVGIRGLNASSLTMATGGGADRVDLLETRTAGVLNIDTGVGNDGTFLSRYGSDTSVSILAGPGDDQMLFGNAFRSAATRVVVDGQDGQDLVRLNGGFDADEAIFTQGDLVLRTETLREINYNEDEPNKFGLSVGGALTLDVGLTPGEGVRVGSALGLGEGGPVVVNPGFDRVVLEEGGGRGLSFADDSGSGRLRLRRDGRGDWTFDSFGELLVTGMGSGQDITFLDTTNDAALRFQTGATRAGGLNLLLGEDQPVPGSEMSVDLDPETRIAVDRDFEVRNATLNIPADAGISAGQDIRLFLSTGPRLGGGSITSLEAARDLSVSGFRFSLNESNSLKAGRDVSISSSASGSLSIGDHAIQAGRNVVISGIGRFLLSGAFVTGAQTIRISNGDEGVHLQDVELTTSGDQSFNTFALFLEGGRGSRLTSTGGGITFTGQIDGGSGQASGHSLTLDTARPVTFDGNIGANTPLNRLALITSGVTLEGQAASGRPGEAILLPVTTTLNQGSIIVTGVPAGAVLSAGERQSDGTWLVPAGQLVGLTLTPASESSPAIIPLTFAQLTAALPDIVQTTEPLSISPETGLAVAVQANPDDGPVPPQIDQQVFSLLNSVSLANFARDVRPARMVDRTPSVAITELPANILGWDADDLATVEPAAGGEEKGEVDGQVPALKLTGNVEEPWAACPEVTGSSMAWQNTPADAAFNSDPMTLPYTVNVFCGGYQVTTAGRGVSRQFRTQSFVARDFWTDLRQARSPSVLPELRRSFGLPSED